MSLDIWTRCAGRTEVRPLATTAWRVVESQERISTRQLVDSDAEHEMLERLIEEAKPRVPGAPEFRGLHFLLLSPFRSPPLRHGSRFGASHEPSLWYGSESLETALAEAAYYRLVFFEGTEARLLPNRISMSAFRAAIRSASGIDLTAPPFDAHTAAISSRTGYTASQRLGSEMRGAGVEAFRYRSARDPGGGVNVALFTPRAFARRAPTGPPVTWHCTVTTAGDVSFLRERPSGLVRHAFPRSTFLVSGELPAPAP